MGRMGRTKYTITYQDQSYGSYDTFDEAEWQARQWWDIYVNEQRDASRADIDLRIHDLLPIETEYRYYVQLEKAVYAVHDLSDKEWMLEWPLMLLIKKL